MTCSVGCEVSETVQVPNLSPATVQILSVTPSDGDTLAAATTIAVELEYRVNEFVEGGFAVGATAQQNQAGHAWTLLSHDGKDFIVLPKAAGTITVVFDARNALEKPDAKYPLHITFDVRQLIGTMGASAIVAETQPVVYKK